VLPAFVSNEHIQVVVGDVLFFPCFFPYDVFFFHMTSSSFMPYFSNKINLITEN